MASTARWSTSRTAAANDRARCSARRTPRCIEDAEVSRQSASRHSGARHLARARNPSIHLLRREMDSGLALRAPRND
ncbi:hypothetical protein E4K64_31785 [Bradyrhizobium frederickii]|uniref:Uncharacterized protein n=1 Tax=Bradyrhizobium frederickii TaxID=2560054 RepID=A0A4Y9NPX2_9BRAD|nr:hypothetical protein E4K64_31785 [Bradyrhizobium frederickii]